jgi:two-component system, OmpR family, osmolarity sensor histidine kinase EnvZ
MRLLPRSLVGRTALLVTLVVILNEMLWFGVVRPALFRSYLQGQDYVHPNGITRVYVEVAWAVFAFLLCSACVYVIFYWMRRQLHSVVDAARSLGRGETPVPLPETGPEEIRALSSGINQLALNLESLDADRRLMLAGVSHDLSTPLTRMRLALELMRMKGDLSHADGMVRDIDEMNAILTQFMDYLGSGKEEEPVAGDFNRVVADVCERYTSTGTAIRPALGTLPPFRFRALAMRRLVTNLVDNAARYGVTGIEVSTGFEADRAVFSVQDRGPGIRSAAPESLIKPFAREDVARGGVQLGAGLGLSIVDRIARIHGGRLRLANRPDGGLQAIVTLPVSQAAP